MNDTTTSITTAAEVVMPTNFMRALWTASAIVVAIAATPKNIPNSTYQRNFPGRNTNARFISQQKTFATTNPAAVATPARNQRASYHCSAPEKTTLGRPSSFTALSSGVRHLRHVEARR